MMLMSQALMQILVGIGNGRLPTDLHELPEGSIIAALWDILICTLQTQREDGSWENIREVTAYAVLTINALSSLPIASPFKEQMDSAIARARQYLWPRLENGDPEFLWIEKVTYGAYTLSQAYMLAALHCSAATHESPHLPGNLSESSKHTQTAKLYGKMPLLSMTAEWRIQAWQIQANFFSSRMRQVGIDLLPRRAAGDNIYTDFIPFSWVAGNNLTQPTLLGSGTLLSMMELSLLIYQVDEIMEGSVAWQSESYLAELKGSIGRLCNATGTESTQSQGKRDLCGNGSTVVRRNVTGLDDSIAKIPNGTGEDDIHANRPSQSKNLRENATEIHSMCPTEITESLTRFVRFVLLHPNAQKASNHDRRQLRINLQEFLLAHLVQINDNRQLRGNKEKKPSTTTVCASTRGQYSTWVRGTGAKHTGGPVAFSFLLCLLGRNTDCLPTDEAKFIADDVSRHMSTLCRMCNDWGSVTRDRREGNLNSVDFAEFREGRQGTGKGFKDALLRLAGYERRCLDLALAELKKNTCDGRVYEAVKILCDVTDMYGQMYALKDLTPYLSEGV